MLECYRPSAKLSTPYLACRFQGTKVADGGDINDAAPRLGDLGRLYSSFRPVVAEDWSRFDDRTQRRRRRRQSRRMRSPPAQSQEPWQGNKDIVYGSQDDGESDDDSDDDEAATQGIDLDEGELFSQLCAGVNVVQQSARPGLFLSHVNTCDGVIRVWRNWLADMSARCSTAPSSASSCSSLLSSSWPSSILSQSDSDRDINFSDDESRSKFGSRSRCSSRDGSTAEIDRDEFLWVDTAKSVGLRFRVEPSGPMTPEPLLLGPDATGRGEPPVPYTLIYEELLVRTSMLLRAVEAAALQVISPSSRAVVIAQFEGLIL
ncbi:hypothetical protein HIM_02572 [Hirsutella minnesotensis 3608]|nr:hypothetical protein HIM_02572 [Hirsutella minnesotensis 3608]